MKVTFIGQVAKVCLQLVGLVVLSRIIAPEYFGFVALHITLVAFLEIIREWGNTTVSLQGLREEYAENLKARKTWFWVSLAIGFLTSIAYVMACVAIQKDLSLEETTAILILSSTLVAGGLNSQHHVQIVLEKRFNLLVSIEVLSQMAALVVALVAINFLDPVVALSLQFATLFWVSALGKTACSGFRPSRPRGVYVRSYFRLGLSLVGLSSTNYWNSNLDNLLISSRFGDSSLGQYNRAFQIYMVPVAQLIWPLEKVVLVHSEEKISAAGIDKFLSETQNKLHILSGYMFTVLGSAGYLMIPWLIGPNWVETATLFQFLCLAGLVQVPLLISYWGFLVSRKNAWLFRIGILRLTIFATALFLLGTQLLLVPFALLLANIVAWMASLALLQRLEKQVRFSHLLNNAARIYAAGVITMIIAFALSTFLSQSPLVTVFLATLIQSTLTFPCLVFALGTRAQKKLLFEAQVRVLAFIRKRKSV